MFVRMRLGFRTAWLWLLLLALPVHGIAAATMLHCGARHHGLWQATVGATAGPHEHHTAAGHTHDGAELPMASAPEPCHGDGASPQALGKVSKFTCSACAACCIGLALLPSPLAWVTPQPAAAPQGMGVLAHADFLAGGQERPPRLSLA